MMDLTHRNVMTLVAIVVRNQKVPLIVLPFMKHGDLKSFVEKNENVLFFFFFFFLSIVFHSNGSNSYFFDTYF